MSSQEALRKQRCLETHLEAVGVPHASGTAAALLPASHDRWGQVRNDKLGAYVLRGRKTFDVHQPVWLISPATGVIAITRGLAVFVATVKDAKHRLDKQE